MTEFVLHAGLEIKGTAATGTDGARVHIQD